MYSKPVSTGFPEKRARTSRNVYSEIHLHLTWHTKSNAAILVDDVERQLHRFLRHRALQSQGVIVDAIRGVADHIHIAVTIPPTLTISDRIGELKGASAHYVNHEICNRKVLEWPSGYGVVSFGSKDLPWVNECIQDQKAHHAEESTHDRVERMEGVDDSAKPVKTGSRLAGKNNGSRARPGVKRLA